ncbi:MAG: dipeptidyl-peptidase 3 family protein [Flavobacteriales bacterium]
MSIKFCNPTLVFSLLFVIILSGCESTTTETSQEVETAPDDWSLVEASDSGKGLPDADGFVWQTEQFADLKIIRYQVPGWEQLSADQKALVYCLNQAGLCGRDIMYDQNNRYNLRIRNLLESIYTSFEGDKNTMGWQRFETYLKRIWFSNGIHHHYANTKIQPEFSEQYFDELLIGLNLEVDEELRGVIFNPAIEAKKVEQDATKGLVESSAINFYAPNVSTEEAQAYLKSIEVEGTRSPVEYSLNSRLVKNGNGEIEEQVYRVGGLYGEALEQVVFWLNQALQYAENDNQAAALRHLILYYETGDLKEWQQYNINWVQATEGDVDYINGFVEVYNDPLGYTGSYETIVQIKDFEASDRMKVLMENAQWFEDNMPFMAEHKKKEVVGITYNVVNVAGEAGDASPSTPIGVNLPNSNWIRVVHGSKSVSLGNIVSAYDMASGSGMLSEFAHDDVEVARSESHGSLAGKLHTAMHEVIGHASGQLEEGVGEPKQTIKEYSSTLEEGRADLVALYFMMDEKMLELGLMETLETGMAEYDSYIRNGMMLQLRRLEKGADIEEAHMRNRAWISHWCFERAQESGIIERVARDGETFFDIKDYQALRTLFGELLREVQRIKSQGDYAAAKALVEGYGVKVDPAIHEEVLTRSAALGIAPYGGFINPEMEPASIVDNRITDVTLSYPEDFASQMLRYSEQYGFLPLNNDYQAESLSAE